MIRTLIYGISLFLLCFLLSCTSLKEIRTKNVILKEYNTFFINDSLQFSYKFPADYKEITKPREVRKAISSMNKTLKSSDCLICFKTFLDPYFQHCLFYYPQDKKYKQILSKIEKSDSFYMDKKKRLIATHIPLQKHKGHVFLIAQDKDAYFFGFKNEYIDIMNNIKVGQDYKNYQFTNPFELTGNKGILDDGSTNYLYPVYVLDKHKANYLHTNSMPAWLQAYNTYLSRLTNANDSSIHEWKKMVKNRTVSLSEAISYNKNAFNDLVSKCISEQVVMINENHFIYHHRFLTQLLLDTLAHHGFKYFAMEAVFEDDLVLNERGFPITKTGFYVQEPMMGNLIRQAVEKGYHVFGYDDFTENREKNQAVNIFSKSLAKDSSAKVLVHAGVAHIDERGKGQGKKKMMAREFFELTGINPLTIGQIEFLTTEASLLIVDTAKIEGQRNIESDIHVANNMDYAFIAKKYNYADYKLSLPDTIKQTKNPENFQYVALIYKSIEFEKDHTATPIYVHLVDDYKKDCLLKLPKNEYRYIFKDRYGNKISSGILEEQN